MPNCIKSSCHFKLHEHPPRSKSYVPNPKTILSLMTHMQNKHNYQGNPTNHFKYSMADSQQDEHGNTVIQENV